MGYTNRKVLGEIAIRAGGFLITGGDSFIHFISNRIIQNSDFVGIHFASIGYGVESATLRFHLNGGKGEMGRLPKRNIIR